MNRGRFTVYPAIAPYYEVPQHNETTAYGQQSAAIAEWNDRYEQLESRGLLDGEDPAVDLAVNFLQENQGAAFAALQTEGVAAYEADVAQYQAERQFYADVLEDAQAKSAATLKQRAGIAAIMPELAGELKSLAVPVSDEALVSEAQDELDRLEREYAHLFAPWSIPRPELRQAVEVDEVPVETTIEELALAGLANHPDVVHRRHGYEGMRQDVTERIVHLLARRPGEYFTDQQIGDVIYDHAIPSEKRRSRAVASLWRLLEGAGSERAKSILRAEDWRLESVKIPKSERSESDKSVRAYRLVNDRFYDDAAMQDGPATDAAPAQVEVVADTAPVCGGEADDRQKTPVELAVEDAERYYGSLLGANIEPGAQIDHKTVRRIFGGVGTAGTVTAYRRLVEAGVLKKSAGKIRANIPLPDLSVPQVLFMRISNSHEGLKNRKGDIERFLEAADKGYRTAWEDYQESSKR